MCGWRNPSDFAAWANNGGHMPALPASPAAPMTSTTTAPPLQQRAAASTNGTPGDSGAPSAPAANLLTPAFAPGSPRFKQLTGM